MLDFIEARGALKSKVDTRDYKVNSNTKDFPKTFVCNYLPPIKNQGRVNSCVAHATAAILETFNEIETGEYIPMSTDFIYGMQGVAFDRLDQGMYLRDACKIVKDYGEVTAWTISTNTEQPKCTEWVKERLNDSVYNEAKIYKVESYAKCKTANDLKYALMNYGPVLASIKWYSEYKIDNNNIIAFDKYAPFGYHAVMICGWNEFGWLCQNSWGRNWNKGGRFIYPFSEKFSEAWSFVDAKNENVYIPNNKKSNFIDNFLKLTNFIANLLVKIKEII